MRVIRDGLWLCVDCLFAAVNGDMPGDAKRTSEVQGGLGRLGTNLVPAFDSETGEGIDGFRSGPCDCCKNPLAGEYHRFAVLGE